MKFLKGFTTLILGILAFALVLSLSLIMRTKNFVEKDLISAIVKEAAKEALDHSTLNEEQKEFIDKVVNDKETTKIINRIEENYLDFQENPNYLVTQEDYDMILDFVLKYQDDINEVYDTKYTKEEIKEAIKYEDVQKYAEDAFNELNTSEDTKDVNEVLTNYIKLTSSSTKLAMFLGIVILMALVALVNWTPVKCLKVLGFDLIFAGVIIGVIFGAAQIAIQNLVTAEEVLNIIKTINLNGYIIMAVCEVVIGGILIAVYKVLNKKRKKKTELIAAETETSVPSVNSEPIGEEPVTEEVKED